jgi:hypothetical protein
MDIHINNPLAILIENARLRWQIDFARALERISDFGDGCQRALGEVSIDDAVDALKLEAIAAIEQMRRHE